MPEIESSGNFISICDNEATIAANLLVDSDLPTTEFVLTNIDQPAMDGLGMMIVGTDKDGAIEPADFGLTFEQRFALKPIAYDLQMLRNWVDVVLNSTAAGTSCCDYIAQASANFCTNLNNAGINVPNDVNTLEDVFEILDVFEGTTETASIAGRLQQMDNLKQAIENLPVACQTTNSLCYAAGTDEELYNITETPVIIEVITPGPREVIIDADISNGILQYSLDGLSWQSDNNFNNASAIGTAYVQVLSTGCISTMNYENTNLSVELIDFKGAAEASTNLLNWTTATESANESFVILRSADAVDFVEIGTIDGAGTSLTSINYTFRDPNPLADIGYYKLHMIDVEGYITESNVIFIERDDPNGFSILSIGPNPSNRVINVSITNAEPGDMEYTIYDMTGRRVRAGVQTINPGINNFPIDADGLGTSMYIFTAAKGEYVVSAYKFIMYQ